MQWRSGRVSLPSVPYAEEVTADGECDPGSRLLLPPPGPISASLRPNIPSPKEGRAGRLCKQNRELFF